MQSKISLHFDAFINKLKRKLHRHHNNNLKAKNTFPKKEQQESQSDVDTVTSYTPQQIEEFRTGHPLVDHLCKSAFALIELRLHADYAAFFPPDSLSRDEQRLHTLLFSPQSRQRVDWAALADHFSYELTATSYGLTSTPTPVLPITTPWTDVLHAVVAHLGPPITSQQLLWGIAECARRSRGGERRSGVEELVAWGRPFALGEQVVEDLLNLPLMYPATRGADRRRMRAAIEKVREKYFVVCEEGRIGVREEAWVF